MRRAMDDLRHQGRQRVVALISEVFILLVSYLIFRFFRTVFCMCACVCVCVCVVLVTHIPV